MRILILPPHELWEPWTGQAPAGTEDRELSWRLLAARGFAYRRVDIFRTPWNPLARAHPILRAIDPLRALRVLLFERRADVVLCHFESSALVLLLLRRLFLFRARIAVLDIGLDEGWALRRRILDQVVPRADALLPLGSNRVAEIEARWRPRGFVRVFTGSVDCAFYAQAPDRPDGPVLAVGDDISRDYATLRAAARLTPHAVAIRTRSVRQQEAPEVRVLSDFLSPGAYRDLIASACIVVLPLHPSRHAGGVSVLVQAMASGRPIVVSRSEGIADYIEHEGNCLIVPCGDAPALAAAIDRLMGDAALRAALGARARAFAVAHLSLEAVADQLETVFRRLHPTRDRGEASGPVVS